MPFEDFTQKGGRARFGFPAVTLLRSGGLSLNGEAYRVLGKPPAIVLAYDKVERRVGIRPAKPTESFAYPVREISEDSYWVAAQGFLKYYGLSATETSRYAASMDGLYLAVDLKKEPVQREKRAATKGGKPVTDKE